MAQWNFDTDHTEIKFKVKHLMISTVTGQFRSFTGVVRAENADFTDAVISFEAEIDSIDTRNSQRDAHLKSPDFFDAANHPKLSFVSKSLIKSGGNNYQLTGDLTIRGITRKIVLDTVYNGTVKEGDGEAAGFEISGKLNRKDFGLMWSEITETGGVIASDEVRLEIFIKLIKAVAQVQKAA